jgi:hypothetical protein
VAYRRVRVLEVARLGLEGLLFADALDLEAMLFLVAKGLEGLRVVRLGAEALRVAATSALARSAILSSATCDGATYDGRRNVPFKSLYRR